MVVLRAREQREFWAHVFLNFRRDGDDALVVVSVFILAGNLNPDTEVSVQLVDVSSGLSNHAASCMVDGMEVSVSVYAVASDEWDDMKMIESEWNEGDNGNGNGQTREFRTR